MPAAVPVATMAIGIPGATNAGLLAARIIGAFDSEVFERLENYRETIRDIVLNEHKV